MQAERSEVAVPTPAPKAGTEGCRLFIEPTEIDIIRIETMNGKRNARLNTAEYYCENWLKIEKDCENIVKLVVTSCAEAGGLL
jgi:hypothetical protein